MRRATGWEKWPKPGQPTLSRSAAFGSLSSSQPPPRSRATLWLTKKRSGHGSPGDTQQITARVVATDASATTVSTTQTPEVLSGSFTVGASTATGIVRNDDGAVEICITAANATLKEGHSGATPFTFTVTREGDLSGTHTVKWAVTGTGSAAAVATDFVGGALPSGMVTFAPGEASKTLTVNVQGDTGVELNETFLVSLSSPAAVVSSGTQTTTNSGTIASTGQTLGISLTAPDASASRTR